MQLFDTILWFFAFWTLLEGVLVFTLPSVSIRITRALFPKWGEFLTNTDPAYLRKLGLIEFTFGLLLAGYLVWSV
ncbi:MAG: hypothetical protein WD708_04535 [Kiritimatiellia bacterium]